MSDPNDPTNRAAPQQIKVQLDEQTAQGTYANLALISHTENEFVLDFVFVQPTRTGAKVNSRVIMSPRQVKRLAVTLSDTVQRYEARFGAIPMPGDDPKIVH